MLRNNLWARIEPGPDRRIAIFRGGAYQLLVCLAGDENEGVGRPGRAPSGGSRRPSAEKTLAVLRGRRSDRMSPGWFSSGNGRPGNSGNARPPLPGAAADSAEPIPTVELGGAGAAAAIRGRTAGAGPALRS